MNQLRLRICGYSLNLNVVPITLKISRHAHAVVLPQVIEILREVFVEDLAPTDRESIAHPAIDAPVVEHFIRDKKRQAPLRLVRSDARPEIGFDIALT